MFGSNQMSQKNKDFTICIWGSRLHLFLTSLSPNSQSSPIPSPKCLGVLLCQILILDQVLICNWHYCIWQPRFYVKCNSTRLSTASLVCPCNRRTIVKTRRYIICLLPIWGVDLEFMALSLSGVYTDCTEIMLCPCQSQSLLGSSLTNT